jgi:sugar phosphate isomerase/epimerase
VRDLSDLSACSINTATLGFQAPLGSVIDAVARAGFGGIAPWRREVEGGDVAGLARQIREAGLKLSGYCRSPYLPGKTRAAFLENVEANKRALNDAAVLGAPVFVMVVGSLTGGSKDIEDARAQAREGVAMLVEHGKKVDVKIGLEPLHPVYAADRSCLTLLSEALEWCNAIEGSVDKPWLGTVIDVYHTWWDPNIKRDIARAGDQQRIFGLHVCDWLLPTTDVLNDRGMMGDGVIDVPKLRGAVEDAGYRGFVECEIFSDRNWGKRPMDETLRFCAQRFGSAT